MQKTSICSVFSHYKWGAMPMFASDDVPRIVCVSRWSLSPFFRDIGSTITSVKLQYCASFSSETKNIIEEQTLRPCVSSLVVFEFLSVSVRGLSLNLFGYSSLKNKVTWQITSFSRDVFVERAELSAMDRIQRTITLACILGTILRYKARF